MNKINQGIILFKMNRSLLSDYFLQNSSICSFWSSDSWVVFSPIELSIKQKIEAIGTPLKDWDINIYRGILTGYNEAFIISGEKRTELLAACETEKERIRTDELIRPILRGRDIKRYTYEFADLYIIATFPAKHYNIDDYPAIKAHLLSYGIERLEQTGKEYTINGEKIKARKKTNNQWFETQDSISYWDDFNKQKIIYPEITKFLNFYYDDEGYYFTNNKCFILTGNYLSFLTGFFNSKLFRICFRDNFPELLGGTRELRKIFIEEIPVIEVSEYIDAQFSELIKQVRHNPQTQEIERQIESKIYGLYGLTEEEIAFIEQVL